MAALALVFSAGQIYSYLLRSGALAFEGPPSRDDLGRVLYTGPAILTAILKVAVGTVLIGSCGWGLSRIVGWVAGGLKDEDELE